MIVFGLICMMAFSSVNSVYTSTGSKTATASRPVSSGSRYGGATYYAPNYGYAGGYAGGFAGGFDPFSFTNDEGDDVYAATNVYTSDDAYANAEASLLPDVDAIHQQNLLFHDQLTASILAQNAYLANQASRGGAYGGSYGATYGGRPGVVSFVGGSTSVGPNGVRHTSYVYPPNAKSPNVDTRYSTHTKPGYFGVSSASYSTNVNGKPQGGSLTAINNNGKVTAYRTHS